MGRALVRASHGAAGSGDESKEILRARGVLVSKDGVAVSMGEMEAARLQAGVARLSLVDESDAVTVGNPATGTFVAVPSVGGVVLRALAAGKTVEEAADEAREHVGVEVDVVDFLAVLEATGVLVADSADADGHGERWITGVPQWLVRPLFSRTAWVCYGAALVFSAVVLLIRPELRPSFENYMFLPDPLAAILVLYAFVTATTVLHECWHWLAARAEGVPARFRVSYRGAFLVAETDLSQLLTLPRGRRYGPLLAGMAFDVSELAVALLLRLLYYDTGLPLNDTITRLLGALVLTAVMNLVFQCAIFLRSDLYALLACALRCENLYRVSWLTLKRRLLPLRSAETEELRVASERDRSVARWFSLLYLVGALAVFAFLLGFVLPSAGGVLYWVIKNIGSMSMGEAAFWESLALGLVTVVSNLAPIPLAIRERRMRRKGVLS